MALTDAVSLAIVTVEAESVAVAEVGVAGAPNVTTPPSTGSTELFAVTVTLSGLANGVPTSVDWGVLPAAAVSLKPWLSKAPMSTAPTRLLPR